VNKRLAALLVSIAFEPALAQPPATVAELWEIVQQQQQQIASLETRLAGYEAQLSSTEQSAAATVPPRTADFDVATPSTAQIMSRIQDIAESPQRTNFAGYGELHYNNLSFADASRPDEKNIDYHRFVTFIGHRFNDRMRFFSEVEIEHSLAGDGAPGEVELEQAWVQFDINDQLSAHTGLFLIPVGILNETHEPPTFYGVERNNVESVILPSTWWEAGAGLTGRNGNGLSWDFSIHSGLEIPTTGSNAFRVRSGRQKVAEAVANNLAMTGRVRYTGIRGLELAASLGYQSDPSQQPGDGLDSGRLFSTHAIYTRNQFSFRGLFARWDFEGDAVEAADKDVQTGYYVEPSYRFSRDMSSWGIYARFEDVEGARDQDDFIQREFGFNYWPADLVTFKFSYMDREYRLDALSGSDFDGFSLGFGYQFY